MTTEEQAREIADKYEWSTDWPGAVVRLSFTRDELIAFLLPALRTREAETEARLTAQYDAMREALCAKFNAELAETWEQAAQEVETERNRTVSLFGPLYTQGYEAGLLHAVATLRARAAQTQEPTT